MSVDATIVSVAGAVFLAVIGVFLVLYYRFGRLESKVEGLELNMREMRREFREDLRAETQRVLDALMYHGHDETGAIFRPARHAPTPADD